MLRIILNLILLVMLFAITGTTWFITTDEQVKIHMAIQFLVLGAFCSTSVKFND